MSDTVVSPPLSVHPRAVFVVVVFSGRRTRAFVWLDTERVSEVGSRHVTKLALAPSFALALEEIFADRAGQVALENFGDHTTFDDNIQYVHR